MRVRGGRAGAQSAKRAPSRESSQRSGETSPAPKLRTLARISRTSGESRKIGTERLSTRIGLRNLQTPSLRPLPAELGLQCPEKRPLRVLEHAHAGPRQLKLHLVVF